MANEGALEKLLEAGIVWTPKQHESPGPENSLTPPGDFEENFGQTFKQWWQTLLLPGLIHDWFPLAEEGPLPFPPTIILSLLTLSSPNKTTVWIGKDSWPTPYLLHSQDNDLSNYTFVDPPDRKLTLWSIETALRSKGVGVVVADCRQIKLTKLSLSKRFALAAKEGGSIGFFIRDPKEAALPSSATTKWSIKPSPSNSDKPRFELKLLKVKGNHPVLDQWLVELCHDEKKISVHIPTTLVDRHRPEREEKLVASK